MLGNSDQAVTDLGRAARRRSRARRVANSCRGTRMTRKRWVTVATKCRRVSEPELDDAEEIEDVLRDLTGFRQQLRDGALTDCAAGYRGLQHLDLL